MTKSNILERNNKMVQFTILFQVLSHWQPMVKYDSQVTLYQFLNAHYFSTMHLLDDFDWLMVEFMYDHLKTTISKVIVGY